MEVYLDNAATTKTLESVRNIMIKTLDDDYGNPSSKHILGVKAEKYIKDTKEKLANVLKVEEKEIIFTSGGTEANNLALIGTALANKRDGNHIITTVVEHPSVYAPLEHLKGMGFEISYIPVDSKGKIIVDELIKLISKDSILISMIYVNNEIGTIQDISDIIKRIRNIKEDIIIHVDGVQAFGKYDIYPKREGIDLLSISAHKIHGPKGIGALYIKDRTKISPILFGGGQQRQIRPGTENVACIAGFGAAINEAYHDLEGKKERLYQVKQRFIEKIQEVDDIVIHGVEAPFGIDEIKRTAPHIVNISFLGVRSEVMLHSLEDKNIYVSSGSACSSNKPELSRTLVGIGLSKDEITSALRFSFSTNYKSTGTTIKEIDYTIETIKELLPILRRYQPK